MGSIPRIWALAALVRRALRVPGDTGEVLGPLSAVAFVSQPSQPSPSGPQERPADDRLSKRTVRKGPENMSDTGVLQQVGIAVGVVSGLGGLVLGILNTIHQRRQSVPRLRVKPMVRDLVERSHGWGERGRVEHNVGLFELANVGRVAVVGSTVGFLARSKGEQGLLVVSPPALDGGQWPRRIEPGETCCLRVKLEAPLQRDLLPGLGRAYASSATGEVFRASRRAMKDFRLALARVRAAPKEPPSADAPESMSG